GTNDAAALAAADVSASLVDATDLARQHADLLLEGSLDGLVQARRMAQRAVRTLRQNRASGLTWNLVALPFAAAGALSPWVAGLGMSARPCIVVLTAFPMQSPRTVPMPRAPALREQTARTRRSSSFRSRFWRWCARPSPFSARCATTRSETSKR